MDSLDSLSTVVREQRWPIGVLTVLLLISLVLAAFFVPISPTGTDSGESLDNQSFGPNGSYTVESTITRDVSDGYIFPSLYGESDSRIGSSEEWNITVTSTRSYDASRATSYTTTTKNLTGPEDPITVEIESYDVGELQYLRLNASESPPVNREVSQCEDTGGCIPFRLSETQMYSITLAEDRTVPRVAPLSEVRDGEFEVQPQNGEFEFVNTPTILDINGDVTTNENGNISKIDATLNRVPYTVMLENESWSYVPTDDGELAIGPKALAPRSTVTLDMSGSPEASVPIERPSWVTEIEQYLENPPEDESGDGDDVQA